MIELPTKIYNQIRQVQKSEVIDMQDVGFVLYYLHTVKAEEASIWIKEHPVDYLRGLLEGFCIDNSQAAQLRDIHNNN